MKLFKKWSKWYDLSVGECNHKTYLLQASRREDGKIRFRVSISRTAYYCRTKTEQLAEVVSPA